MNVWQYIAWHPWWTLIYLVLLYLIFSNITILRITVDKRKDEDS